MMHWYKGSIPAAIAEAKEKKKLFLVYIEGKDELSKQMTTTYNDAAVADRLSSDGCVSLKLESDSEACKQFSQIYPVCIVPSSFFIGNDGIPLEVIAGNLEPEKFLDKIDKVIKLHSEKTSSGPSNVESKQEIDEASGSGAVPKGSKTDSETAAASLNTETTSTYALSTYQVSSAEQEEKPMDVELPSGNSANEEPKQSTSSSAKDEDFEQKVKRARKLIEEKNIQREEEAKKKELEREKERRKTGKELQKSQRKREQNDLQEWAKDRAKEKEEERLAREKVLAQIAQDRAERAARYQQMVEKKSTSEQKQGGIDKKPESERVTASSASNFANIQFRLPDGTSIIHQFPASATLEEAKQYIDENVKLGYTIFTLSTTFPRREFTRNDYVQTLLDLQLVPSATVLVLPVHSIRSTSDSCGLTALLWSLLAPFTLIWSYIISYFSSSSTSSKNTKETTSQPSTNSKDNEKREEGDAKSRTNRRTFYQEGNIYRLSNQQGDDDDNNTWNGNSTQQM